MKETFMTIYVLIASDKTISGVYSSKDKLISDLTTTFAATAIHKVETWEVDKGFIDYLKISKQTTVTIEN